jgi:hypothetical protein
MTFMERSTPVSTTGATNFPGKPSTSTGPPHSTVAPLATASSSCSITSANCPSLFMGPIWVAGSFGSPGEMARAPSTSRDTNRPPMRRST